MDTLACIHRHLYSLKANEVVTCRQLLHAGPRRQVDKAIAKCIKEGIIVRVTRGVYLRNMGNIVWPAIEEVARIKAEAFGRLILVHGRNMAKQNGLPLKRELNQKQLVANESDLIYVVDSPTSSFRCYDRVIHFRKACKKILHISDDATGKAIRALMHVGRRLVKKPMIEQLRPFWGSRSGQNLIAVSKQWMHAWLGDFFTRKTYCGPGSKLAGPNPDSKPGEDDILQIADYDNEFDPSELDTSGSPFDWRYLLGLDGSNNFKGDVSLDGLSDLDVSNDSEDLDGLDEPD